MNASKHIYCPYSVVSTEILKNTCKKVNIPFALQPNFLRFLIKAGFKVSSCYKASSFSAKLNVVNW